MNPAELRQKELENRVTTKNRLQGLQHNAGWLELKDVIQSHIVKYDKKARNQSMREENRIRALDCKRAMEDLLLDIEQRINCGKSAEHTLDSESA